MKTPKLTEAQRRLLEEAAFSSVGLVAYVAIPTGRVLARLGLLNFVESSRMGAITAAGRAALKEPK